MSPNRTSVRALAAASFLLLSPARSQQATRGGTPEVAAVADHRQAVAFAGAQLERLCVLAGSGYPDHTVNGKWRLRGPSNWTAGYFAGMLWLMYGHTKDPAWLERARKWTEPIGAFRHEKRDLNLGLSFMPTFVAGHRLTGDATYRRIALDAADSLAARFMPGGYIRSWGTVGDPKQQEIIIIDCLIDLDLLYWAARQSGNGTFSDIATSHARITVDTAIRPDGSSVQVIELDPRTGRKVADRHKQGISPRSCWSRGQAFGIYALADIYRFTGEARFLDGAERLSGYWLKNIPEDYVPYWDFDAPRTAAEPRDSSAAAMAAGGFWKLSKLVKDKAQAGRYREAAIRTLNALTQRYRASGPAVDEGRILVHATLHKPAGLGIDESMILGDYYYLELLLDVINDDAGGG
jgi:unsaturated chondroitin disaccharide hydrolase